MQTEETHGRVLNLERFRVRKRLESCGLEWREDKKGKVKVWIRLNQDELAEAREREAELERRKFKLLQFSPLEG